MAVTSNQTVATALQQGSAGISFGGAGFLIFYYIGRVPINEAMLLVVHTMVQWHSMTCDQDPDSTAFRLQSCRVCFVCCNEAGLRGTAAGHQGSHCHSDRFFRNFAGIIEILSSLGVITTSSKIAGASSGALITASQCSGLGTAEILQSAFDLADACRGRQSCSGTLDRELQKLLKGHLPPDAWKRCRDSGFFAISSGEQDGW